MAIKLAARLLAPMTLAGTDAAGESTTLLRGSKSDS